MKFFSNPFFVLVSVDDTNIVKYTELVKVTEYTKKN